VTARPTNAIDAHPAEPGAFAMTADSGQGRLFRAYVSSRPAVYAAVIGSAAAFVYGASQRDVLIMALGPLAVPALVILVAAVAADRGAAERFFRHYAGSVGLDYWGRAGLQPLTPLLGAGDRRWCEHWMAGRLPGDAPLSGGIGQLVWEERRGRRRGDAIELGDVTVRHRATICVADLEDSIRVFHGVFVRPRRGLIATVPDWLSDTRTRPLEVESAAFSQRYELLAADDQDELLARQLLSPSLVLWLAEHPLEPGFELRAGMLVVFVDRALSDEGSLTFLLDAMKRIASRVVQETAEAAARPAARAAAPPAARA
jgi:hypothetical protein